jgi:hypothetical protein
VRARRRRPRRAHALRRGEVAGIAEADPPSLQRPTRSRGRASTSTSSPIVSAAVGHTRSDAAVRLDGDREIELPQIAPECFVPESVMAEGLAPFLDPLTGTSMHANIANHRRRDCH